MYDFSLIKSSSPFSFLSSLNNQLSHCVSLVSQHFAPNMVPCASQSNTYDKYAA